jgi:hypothetical protein
MKYTLGAKDKNMTYTKNQIEFLFTLAKMFPGQTKFTRKELLLAKTALGYSVIPVWITGDPQRKSGRATYSFPELANDLTTLSVSNDTRGAPRKIPTAATSAASSATP